METMCSSWLHDIVLPVDCPYHLLAPPKGEAVNLACRTELLSWTATSFEAKQLVWNLCARDILYWLNCFVWTYDPRRPPGQAEIPFISWPYQDKTFYLINQHINHQDLFIDKSRDMGATWMVMAVFTHRFLFARQETFLCLSRKEDMVDNPGDPDTLFWKADFILQRLPAWMLPSSYPQDRNNLKFINKDRGNSIIGMATTGDASVGGRRTACFFDEFSRVEEGNEIWRGTADVTKCRIVCGTPWGAQGQFYALKKSPGIRKITLHWCLHPEKAAGLYVKDGKERSPWYDSEVARRGNDLMDVAMNLDIDYQASGSPFFSPEIVELLLKKCKPPLQRYRKSIDFESATVKELIPDDNGHQA
jgi:hypothetical protein